MIHIQWKKTIGQTFLHDTRKECLMTMAKIDNLSNHKWHFYRKLLNEYDFESREFAVNRAFYKLWEIIGDNPELLPRTDNSGCLDKNEEDNENNEEIARVTTLHLAEAPGSFVQVVKKMNKTCRSIAVSKPPSSYAEVVRKGRTIPTFADNVLALENTEFLYVDLLSSTHIWSQMLDNFKRDPELQNGFDFITADGGFDEEEQYDLKEILHYNLILSEIVCILLTQKINGGCVVKIFETFTETTLHMLWLLVQHYDSFEFSKPSTSRPTNAEKYIICKGFKGARYDKWSLLNLINMKLTKDHILDFSFDSEAAKNVPQSFKDTFLSASEKFTRNQINTINDVMKFVSETGNKQYIDKSSYNANKHRTFHTWKDQYEFT